MDGAALAERIRAEVAAEAAELGSLGLATVLVGDDPASQIYIGRKHEAAREAGIEPHDHHLPAGTSEADLLALTRQLNADDSVDGILVQLPLPAHIDESRVLRSVAPIKDVDGFNPASAGQLYLDEPTFVPATPLGIMALLEEYERRSSRCARGRDRAEHDRRQAGGAPALARERDGDDLPLAHGRPCPARGRRRRGRRSRRTGGARLCGDDQARRRRDRRRDEPDGSRACAATSTRKQPNGRG